MITIDDAAAWRGQAMHLGAAGTARRSSDASARAELCRGFRLRENPEAHSATAIPRSKSAGGAHLWQDKRVDRNAESIVLDAGFRSG
jgi:hypothetical protein